MSKGSKRRPTLITDEQFKAEWDRIFGKAVAEVVQDEEMAEHEEGATSQAPSLSVPAPQGEVRTG